MSERRSARRMAGVVTSVLAFGAYLVLAVMPAQAAAANCTYDSVNRRVTFVMQSADDGVIGVGAGGAIVADDDKDLAGASQCGVATVNNTDGITIDAATAAAPDDLVVDLRGGPIGPGETPEASGIAEIEITVDGDGTEGELEIDGKR